MAIKWTTNRKAPARQIVEENRNWIESERAKGKSWRHIAAQLGMSRQALLLWLDPNRIEKERERKRLQRERERRELGVGPGRPDTYRNWEVREGRVVVMGELPPPDTRDLTARILGDPLPGRSYLDRMRAQQEQRT